MKKQISTVFVMFGLLASITAPSIGAQLGDVTVQADVPFSFNVGDTTLPPGKYVIRELEPSNPEIVEIRSADGRTAVLRIGRPTQTDKPPQRPQLAFQHIGNRYFLSQIWLESGEGV